MSKIFKIVGWVLGILGIILGIICLSTSGGNVDVLLRYTYFLLIAAVVILVGLVILMAAKNNPKSLIKGLLVLVGIVALVLICYAVSKGAPALSLKSQPSASMLKLTDTILLLTEILGIAAIAAIIFAVIRNVITK
ncbi:MAG: hypothetical protein IK145_07485 [Bacteroidales bacterium]|jgi:hypothetical protein|nr:hypothetical protein [Bacteroidales bacterium]MBR5397675.1 hypothetical protein [Bacteroidales bacterium]